MKTELLNYDIYPKVFPAGKEGQLTIKPLGAHVAFAKETYHIRIMPMSQGAFYNYKERNNVFDFYILQFRYNAFLLLIQENLQKDHQPLHNLLQVQVL